MIQKTPARWAMLGSVLTLIACNDAPSSNQNAPNTSASATPPAPAAAEPQQMNRDTSEHWPALRSPIPEDAALEAKVTALLEQMTLEEKVGQMIQADHSNVTPDDVREYHLGSVLNGGNSVPGGHKYATTQDAIAEADSYWEASTDTSNGRTGIPIIWGTDAVHGHNNMVGATIFPHNIGLGAARNPELLREIAKVTATEVAATGLDWTFAPTLAVVENTRWGRSYESYSEDPSVVASYSGPLVEGLQGSLGDDWLGSNKVIASAKHFVGDGGTIDGVDQGDTVASEEELANYHAAGYFPALQAGVQTVMASFSSWNGKKLHGHRYLLTDVLKGQLGFDGFVVGDWNGHGQVDGCNNENCPQSIIAGVDMLMAPDSWKGLYTNTLAQARAGEIPPERIDDAVRRILRVKMRAGIFDKGKPSSRPLAGQQELLGSAEHRAIARQATRESLVLLKNNDGLLPLNPQQRLLVAGSGADSIMKQTGGWTLSWQGNDNSNEDFPNGQSIYAGIAEAVAAAGGQTTLAADGQFETKPDAAIVVFGEDPYAEFQGDVQHIGYQLEQPADLAVLERLQAQGIPVVGVFLSGRPMWINPHLNAAQAFVAAWLPGTEGGAIADLIIADADGNARHQFSGRLPFSWPASAREQTNGTTPLFDLGYGLDYQSTAVVAQLSTRSGLAKLGADYRPILLFDNGKLYANMKPFVGGEVASAEPVTPQAGSNDGPVRIRYTSRDRQDDSLNIQFEQGGQLVLASDAPLDADGIDYDSAELTLDLLVTEASANSQLSIALDCGAGCESDVSLSDALNSGDSQWQRLSVPMSCFSQADAAMAKLNQLIIKGTGNLDLSVSRIAIEPATEIATNCARVAG